MLRPASVTPLANLPAPVTSYRSKHPFSAFWPTLRTFTFDPADPTLGPGGVPACVESSSTFGGLGLESFDIYAFEGPGCPCV